MKKIFFVLFAGLLLISGCSPKSLLTPDEKKLLKSIGFDSKLLNELKVLTNSNFQQLPAIDQETGDILEKETFDGIYAAADEDDALMIVYELKPGFSEEGYLIFVSEQDYDNPCVSVIKGTDEMDILRYRRTDGINYGLENDDIVNKISEWNDKYGVAVLGCGRDWLEIEFGQLPDDMESFAQEVYEFCPDIVDQGVGDIETLKQAIMEMGGLWLWWD